MSPLTAALLLAIAAAGVLCQGPGNAPFHVIREWKYLNFTWINREDYEGAVARGRYVPENNLVAGLRYFEDVFYLTLPRMKGGVPATLAKIPAGFDTSTAPPLQPFPSWGMNEEGNCEALQNVQNIEIDAAGMMWIIDGGRTNTLGQQQAEAKCGPKLIIYDIRGGRISTNYAFPEEVASKNGGSFLYDLVVDQSDGGYAYITDNSGKDPGIIVYSRRSNRSWKLRHSQTMRADPTASVFKVGDTTVNSPINVAAIALGPQVHAHGLDQHARAGDTRDVYYCPLSSLHLYSINTTVLKNEENGRGGEYQGEVNSVGLKASQTASMIMDSAGVLYYGLLGDDSVARWDSHTSFAGNQRVITRDKKYIQWTSAFAFDASGNLTLVTNRLQKFIYSTLDLGEDNFRLLSGFTGGKSYVYDGDSFDYKVDQPSYHEPKASPEPSPDQHDHRYYHHDFNNMANGTGGAPSSYQPQPKSTAHGISSVAFMVLLAPFLALKSSTV